MVELVFIGGIKKARVSGETWENESSSELEKPLKELSELYLESSKTVLVGWTISSEISSTSDEELIMMGWSSD